MLEVRITSLEPFAYETLSERNSLQTSSVILVLALVKGERFDQAVQMAVELGVAGIIPWQANRSIVKLDAKKRAKESEKLRQLVVASSKQSRRAFFPAVGDFANTKQLVTLLSNGNISKLTDMLSCGKNTTSFDKVLLYEHAFEMNAPALKAASKPAIAIIGPEGGISNEEVSYFQELGFEMAHLGELILRTPTAVAKTLSILNG